MPGPIHLTTVASPDEVQQILELQARNHQSVLSPETIADQGFVTVRHDPAVLLRMNQETPGIIAKAGDRVVGYALVMPRSFVEFVSILRPLFGKLEKLSWRGTQLRENPHWFVMGQICIAEGFRGLGIFDGLYRTMADTYRDRFDFTVTEISARNPRSLRAHARVGFQTLYEYDNEATGEHWHVVVLDFV